MTPYHFSHSEDIKSEAALVVMPGTAQRQSMKKVVRGMTNFSHSEDIKREDALAVMPGTAQGQSMKKVVRGMTNFFYVYILKSLRFADELYIGSTHNLKRRVHEHNAGDVRSTRRYMPWRLIYYEAFCNESAARQRESHLKKNGNPMRELKKRIGWPEFRESGKGFTPYHLSISKGGKGFTLIETMVAISILTVAVVAPMSLAMQSLSTAYYARDQITAFHLAQEAIESVRHLRDGRILEMVLIPINPDDPIPNLFGTIPTDKSFVIDTLNDTTRSDETMSGLSTCYNGTFPPLKIIAGSSFYSHGSNPCVLAGNESFSGFTRTVYVTTVTANELHIKSTVSWRTGHIKTRTFTISDNLYRWAGPLPGA